MIMDIKTLKYFLVVAQEQNITRAAEKLCMAQPPLSRQMKLLEEELGVILFLRGKRRLQLTEEGYVLKQRAEEIVLLVERTRNQLEKMGKSEYGRIVIGATETCGAGILAEAIEQFHKAAPHVRFEIWSGNGDEIRERLEKNLVDMAIIREPFNMESYDRIYMLCEPWIAVLPIHHPLVRDAEDGIELSGLKNEPLMIPIRQPIQDEISNWFHEIATEQNIFCLYNSITSVISLAERGMGIVICPESAENFIDSKKVVCKKIINPEHESKLFLVKRQFQVLPAASELFWDFVRTHLKIRTADV